MGGKRRTSALEQDRRLDQFLKDLEIEKEKREQIIKHVEGLTFDVLRRKSEESSAPRLRLKR